MKVITVEENESGFYAFKRVNKKLVVCGGNISGVWQRLGDIKERIRKVYGFFTIIKVIRRKDK